jgi:hypothetical protein
VIVASVAGLAIGAVCYTFLFSKALIAAVVIS